MRSLQEYLIEGLLDKNLNKSLDDRLIIDNFEAAFVASNKWANKLVDISVNNDKISIKADGNMDIAFTQKMQTVCKKFKIKTIDISGVRNFHLENAAGLEFNIQAESVLFGGYWKTKSMIKDCTINCDRINIPEDGEGKKNATNVIINAKVANIAAEKKSWSGCVVNADKVIVPFIKFIPSLMNDYSKGKFDFAKDFDYNELRATKKTNWSPNDLFGRVDVDAKVIVLQNSVSDYLWDSLGLDANADPNKPIYYMTKFVKGGSKEFGGYELVFDRIPNDNNNTIDAYIGKL